jgi:hypothetical protein
LKLYLGKNNMTGKYLEVLIEKRGKKKTIRIE